MALSGEEQAQFRQLTEAAEKGELQAIAGTARRPQPGEGRLPLLAAGVPEEVLDRLHLPPYEWCRQYSMGEVSRGSLVYALGNLSYPPEHLKTQGLPHDLLADDRGSVGEIGDAFADGLIDLELLTEIRAVRENEQSSTARDVE